MTPHKIIKSKRKTLSLSINENAELIVRAPNKISNKQIAEFIIEKSKWINKNKSLMQSRINEMNNSQSNYLFLGNIYPLIKVNEDPNKIDFNGTEFITSIENQDKFKSALKSFLDSAINFNIVFLSVATTAPAKPDPRSNESIIPLSMRSDFLSSCSSSSSSSNAKANIADCNPENIMF